MIAIDVAQPQVQVARRTKRIGAFIIDHVTILSLMMAAMMFILGEDFIDGDFEMIMVAMIPVIAVGMSLYLFKDIFSGRSFGKWLVGITIRDARNPMNTPTTLRLVLRNILIYLWPIEFIVLAASPEKRRLGDFLAGTIVVDVPEKKSGLQIAAAVAVFVLLFGSLFSMVGAGMKSSDAYKKAIYAIENENDIIEETGGIEGYGMMPSGEINIKNGYGVANFRISVKGKEKDLSVHVYLTKDFDGEWVVEKVNW
jgi:uncharacterized RDD family membrane protein YckC